MRICECAMCEHSEIGHGVPATHIGFFEDVHAGTLPIALCTECSEDEHQDGASHTIQPMTTYARGLTSYLGLFLAWTEGEENEFTNQQG